MEASYHLQHSKDQHRYWVTVFLDIGKRCSRLQRLYDASKEKTAAGPQQGGPAPALAAYTVEVRWGAACLKIIGRYIYCSDMPWRELKIKISTEICCWFSGFYAVDQSVWWRFMDINGGLRWTEGPYDQRWGGSFRFRNCVYKLPRINTIVGNSVCALSVTETNRTRVTY